MTSIHQCLLSLWWYCTSVTEFNSVIEESGHCICGMAFIWDRRSYCWIYPYIPVRLLYYTFSTVIIVVILSQCGELILYKGHFTTDAVCHQRPAQWSQYCQIFSSILRWFFLAMAYVNILCLRDFYYRKYFTPFTDLCMHIWCQKFNMSKVYSIEEGSIN